MMVLLCSGDFQMQNMLMNVKYFETTTSTIGPDRSQTLGYICGAGRLVKTSPLRYHQWSGVD